jgi:hypothetical protein
LWPIRAKAGIVWAWPPFEVSDAELARADRYEVAGLEARVYVDARRASVRVSGWGINAARGAITSK